MATCRRVRLFLGWLIVIVGDSCAYLPGSLLRKRLAFGIQTHQSLQSTSHSVDGVDCIEVNLNVEGENIVVLEATADSQDTLVSRVLEEDGSMEDPYGAVLWPAALSVAQYICEHDLVRQKSVLELGTGTGLVSLVASGLGGASRVLATDYEPLPLLLVDYVVKLNDVPPNVLETQIFDICDPTVPLPVTDIVLVADIMYEPATGKAMARRAVEAMKNGSRVIVGDSPGRAGRPAFLKELKRLGIHQEFCDVEGESVTGARNDLICGPTSTTVSDKPKPLTISLMDLSS